MDDIKQAIEEIESTEEVALSFNPATQRIVAEGKASAVDRALERLKAFSRDDVVAALGARLPKPAEELVTREIALNVPSLGVQRANYERWFRGRSQIYWRTESELDAMFAQCEEGDEILFDFAYSFTVRKPNGRLLSINSRGQIEPVSTYSPHLPRTSGID